jgi:hypothetical protein
MSSTDNGKITDTIDCLEVCDHQRIFRLKKFPSKSKKLFCGMRLAIVRGDDDW